MRATAAAGALVLAASRKAPMVITDAVLARAGMPMRGRAGHMPVYFR